MKNTLLPVISVLLLPGFILSSCNRNDGPQPDRGFSRELVVKRLEASANDFIRYDYNVHKAVVHYYSQWQNSVEGGISKYDLRLYYQDGRLKEGALRNGKIVYHYDQGRIISAENFLTNSNKLSTQFFRYNTQGQLVETEEFIREGGQDIPSTRINYTYYSNGNLKKSEHYHKEEGDPQGAYELNMVTFYEAYDTKPNPIPDDVLGHFLPGLLQMKNNPLRIRIQQRGSTMDDILRIQYSYDLLGNPQKREQQLEYDGELKPSILTTYYY